MDIFHAMTVLPNAKRNPVNLFEGSYTFKITIKE